MGVLEHLAHEARGDELIPVELPAQGADERAQFTGELDQPVVLTFGDALSGLRLEQQRPGGIMHLHVRLANLLEGFAGGKLRLVDAVIPATKMAAVVRLLGEIIGIGGQLADEGTVEPGEPLGVVLDRLLQLSAVAVQLFLAQLLKEGAVHC
jgi:hypothetical protein